MSDRRSRRGPRYPRVRVKLVGEELIPFKMVNKVRAALREHGVPTDQIKQFAREALDDDMDHLIATCALWVTVT